MSEKVEITLTRLNELLIFIDNTPVHMGGQRLIDAVHAEVQPQLQQPQGQISQAEAPAAEPTDAQ